MDIEIDMRNKKIFEEIRKKLDHTGSITKEMFESENERSLKGLLHKVNTLPYGTSTDTCHDMLVVVVDDSESIESLITKALLHIGKICKGITVYVLFYVAVDRKRWVEIWKLFAPSFDDVAKNNNVTLIVKYRKHSGGFEMNKDIETLKAVREYFRRIITALNGAGPDPQKIFGEGGTLYGKGLLDGINTIPYGFKTDTCHDKLLVIIDGKTNIETILLKTLLHVGKNCKNVTVYVLFYIAVDKKEWEEIWKLFVPSFDNLATNSNLVYIVEYRDKRIRSGVKRL